MFSIFNRKGGRASADYGFLGCDMHSHLIPGIDDGSSDLDTSIRLIRGLSELGFRKIITTPHVNWDHFPNTPEIIMAGYEKVQAEFGKHGIDVEFHAAAEYQMDEHFSSELSQGRPLLTLTRNWVLVELSFAIPSMNLQSLLFELQIKGYQPVLAHPERYLYFGADKSWYDRIRDSGCLFQVNLLSLAGHYGKGPQQLAGYLVKKKYVDLFGTDLHHEGHLAALANSHQTIQSIRKLVDEGGVLNSTM
jgi:tyrosine-protein phosphatase YwqE